MAYYRNTRRTPQSKWMDAKYAGNCKVCQRTIQAGERVYWDAPARTITCHNIDCCQADGLTSSQWSGSPVSGQFIQVRQPQRVGSPYIPAN